MAIRFSSYLSDILESNRRLRARKLPIAPVPTEKELEEIFGGKFEYLQVLARIGYGVKIHKITIKALNTTSGYIVVDSTSVCGSQKWSVYGKSPLQIFESDDLSKVTCDKCLGIRVPGGKREVSKVKRIPVDPLSHPRKFHFYYKVDLPATSFRGEIVGAREHDYASGMTPEESRTKIEKHLMKLGYYSRVYDFELQSISAWNGKVLWRKP